MGDELAVEVRVGKPHDQRNGVSGSLSGLDVGEAAVPGQIDLLRRQGLYGRRVIDDGDELDLHPELLFQVPHQGFVLPEQLRRDLIRDGRHPENLRRIGRDRLDKMEEYPREERPSHRSQSTSHHFSLSLNTEPLGSGIPASPDGDLLPLYI